VIEEEVENANFTRTTQNNEGTYAKRWYQALIFDIIIAEC